MKFIVKHGVRDEVELSLREDYGNVDLIASNGQVTAHIASVMEDGRLVLVCNREQLEALGFPVNDNDEISHF